MDAKFTFHDKNGNVLASTSCTSLVASVHQKVIQSRPSNHMDTRDMLDYSKYVYNYIDTRYPWAIQGEDIEDWAYTPDYQEFHTLMADRNNLLLADYYEKELAKVRFFADKKNIWDMWKLRNIYELMNEYSAKEDAYAVYTTY